MVRRALALAAVVALFACGGDSSGPSSDVPALGLYDYTADVRVRNSLAERHFTGTLQITFASEDSIAGVWSVDGYETRASLGFFNVDAYVLYAFPDNDSATIPHRIGRGGDTLPCEVRYTWVDGGFIDSNVGTCTLHKR